MGVYIIDNCDPLSENLHSSHNFRFFFPKHYLQCLRSGYSKFQLNQASSFEVIALDRGVSEKIDLYSNLTENKLHALTFEAITYVCIILSAALEFSFKWSPVIGQTSKLQKLPLNWLHIYLWWRFCQESGSNFVYVYHIVNKHTWQTHRSGYRNKTKIFELSIARRVRCYIIFVDLKLPSLIAGPINLCKYFPVELISQIIFNFRFFLLICMLVQTMQVFAERVTIILRCVKVKKMV